MHGIHVRNMLFYKIESPFRYASQHKQKCDSKRIVASTLIKMENDFSLTSYATKQRIRVNELQMKQKPFY